MGEVVVGQEEDVTVGGLYGEGGVGGSGAVHLLPRTPAGGEAGGVGLEGGGDEVRGEEEGGNEDAAQASHSSEQGTRGASARCISFLPPENNIEI